MNYKEIGIKLLKVAGYILASMAVVALGMYINNPSVSIEELKTPALVAGANILLVFIRQFLPSSEIKNK